MELLEQLKKEFSAVVAKMVEEAHRLVRGAELDMVTRMALRITNPPKDPKEWKELDRVFYEANYGGQDGEQFEKVKADLVDFLNMYDINLDFDLLKGSQELRIDGKFIQKTQSGEIDGPK